MDFKMRLFVLDEVSFVHKSFLTNVTLIWPVFFMDHANMSFQVALHPKGFGTLITLEKSCFSMSLLVCFQKELPCEAFVTLITLEFPFTLSMGNDHVFI